jgi:hypothetical protein
VGPRFGLRHKQIWRYLVKIEKIKRKLQKTYSKMLSAYAKRLMAKAYRLEDKAIMLELALKEKMDDH